MMENWLHRGAQWLVASERVAKKAKAVPAAAPASPRSEVSTTEVEAAPLTSAAGPVTGTLKPIVPRPVSPLRSNPTSDSQGAVLTIGQSVSTTSPQFVVAGLPPGVHSFTLQVTDNLGASSAPVSIEVVVNPAVSEQSGPK
jgi:hypothetical protein